MAIAGFAQSVGGNSVPSVGRVGPCIPRLHLIPRQRLAAAALSVATKWAAAFVFILVGIGRLPAEGVESTPEEPVLIGEWLLDEGAGPIAHDTSGRRHDGSIGTTEGAMPTWRPDWPSLQFSGGQGYVHVPSDQSFEVAHLTIEAWVKDASGVLRYAMSLGNQDNPAFSQARSWGLWAGKVNPQNKGLSFYVTTGSGGAYAPDVDASIWDSRWHHFAGTYDGTAVRAYIDGTEVGQGTKLSGDIIYGPANQNDVWIGSNAGTGGSTSEVKIAGVRLYRGALSPAQIKFDAGRFDYVKPLYNELFRKATHNSYWLKVANAKLDDIAASGVQERILDQLLHEHVRGLELDLHYEAGHPGEFTIYHTSNAQANSGCHYLTDCLQLLQRLDYLLPNHEPVNLVLEFKEDPIGPTFGDNSVLRQKHHIQDLDRQLWERLGSRLYTPRELVESRCPGASTLRACIAAAGWPTVAELRGRYIVNVIGNWSDDYFDWIAYANDDGGVLNRAAFPLRSMLTDNLSGIDAADGLSPPGYAAALGSVDYNPYIELSTDGLKYTGRPDLRSLVHDSTFKAKLLAARDASIFWQVESDGFALATGPASAENATGEFLSRAKNVVARSHDAFFLQTQADIVTGCAILDSGCTQPPLGYQLIQTDFPWSFINDLPTAGGNVAQLPTNPSRPLFERADVDHSASRRFREDDLLEPGYRMYLRAAGANAQALIIAPAGADSWEMQSSNTTVTHDDQLGPAARPVSTGYITLQSSRDPEHSHVRIGRVQLDDPSRTVAVRVLIADGGTERGTNYPVPHQEPQPGDIGDLLRAEVKQGGGSTVTLYTAGRIKPDGTPDWHATPEGVITVHDDLNVQGFTTDGDVLIAAARHNGRLVRPGDFTQIVSGPTNVVDLTLCGAENSACVPLPQGAEKRLTSPDGIVYRAIAEASGEIFGGQERHLYTADAYEARTSGLTAHVTLEKFGLRTDQPDSTWAPAFRCVDWRRDLHTFWLSTSTVCDNSGDDSGEPNGLLGYLSTVPRPNMTPLIHLRKGTHNATGAATATPEHDTHDHIFALGLAESAGIQSNGYELRETLGYVFGPTAPPP